ncbi:MAG: LacI family DNA-binding transcriptional regulator [Pseudomonadota bacterium]
MPRPTVHDIARHAGVSLATVDRVLNARPGVREATIQKVNQAISRIGYVRDLTAANLARQRDYEFVFMLPDRPGGFTKQLRKVIDEVAAVSAIDRSQIRTQLVPSSDPHAFVLELQKLDPSGLDGLAIIAPETPHVRDAIHNLAEQGVPVVAIISDLPSSDIVQFVGINNAAAGGTAGRLMGSFVERTPSDILVVAGSLQAREYVERRLGFDRIMADRFGHLNVLPTVEIWDDPDLLIRTVGRVLDRQSNISGIYSLGVGNAGLLKLITERYDPKDPKAPVVIVHELTDVTRRGLMEERFAAVIAQDVGHVVRSAVRMMRARSDGRGVLASQEKIRIEVIVKENLS